jgi:hypothetical protein
MAITMDRTQTGDEYGDEYHTKRGYLQGVKSEYAKNIQQASARNPVAPINNIRRQTWAGKFNRVFSREF